MSVSSQLAPQIWSTSGVPLWKIFVLVILFFIH